MQYFSRLQLTLSLCSCHISSSRRLAIVQNKGLKICFPTKVYEKMEVDSERLWHIENGFNPPMITSEIIHRMYLR